MSPFLSIIVPVYKIKEVYLKRCLNSLGNQNRKDYCVIIIDDGSPDKCGEICDTYVANSSLFKVIHQENCGVSVARNRGIDMVTTPWLTFVDPDDWVEPDFVTTLAELKDNNADIVMYNCYQEFERKTIKNSLPIPNGYLTDDWLEKVRISTFHYPKINGKYHLYEYGALWNKLYRTDLIMKHHIRFIPEAHKGQDELFNAVAYQCAKNIYYFNKRLYHYRCSQSSISNRFNDKIICYNEISFREKKRILQNFHLSKKYWEAYYSHVLITFHSYLRLYYFHSKNIMSWNEKKIAVNTLLRKEPYLTALKQSHLSLLSLKQQIFVFFLRHRMYFMLWILVRGNRRLKVMIGKELQE